MFFVGECHTELLHGFQTHEPSDFAPHHRKTEEELSHVS